MFRVINFLALIRWIAILTSAISICVYEIARRYWFTDITIFKILTITPWVSLLIIALLTTSIAARLIWKILRVFNKSLFPDINGTWAGEITTNEGIVIPARALIRQSLLQTQIDIHTKTSKSITLETTPATESGQSKIYYTYKAIPKNLSWSSYTGSTIFDVRTIAFVSGDYLELSGTYFTDRGKQGRIRLRQVNLEIHTDVSFY